MAKTKTEQETPVRYVAVRGFSTPEIFHREAGEVVEASELTPEELAELLSEGVIAPAEEN